MPEVTKQVAVLEVGVGGMNRSSIEPSLPEPERDRAQAVAHHLHRHRLVLVGEASPRE